MDSSIRTWSTHGLTMFSKNKVGGKRYQWKTGKRVEKVKLGDLLVSLTRLQRNLQEETFIIVINDSLHITLNKNSIWGSIKDVFDKKKENVLQAQHESQVLPRVLESLLSNFAASKVCMHWTAEHDVVMQVKEGQTSVMDAVKSVFPVSRLT